MSSCCVCAGEPTGSAPEGVDAASKPLLALRLAFNLPSAAYATMLVLARYFPGGY